MSDEILQFRFQNLHEFVKVARQNLDRNNWDYLIGGSESETTLARNRRAAGKGYDAFCLTIDTDSYSRRERDIAKRHQRRRVRVDDARIYQAQFNWKDIERIKRNFDIPLILKGIATAEDAKIAVEHGVDCVYVSNHGGRQLDQGLGSVAVLPEVVEAGAGRARGVVGGAITRRTAGG